MSEKDAEVVKKILKELETLPYIGFFGQHPLWEFYDRDNECVIWSAKINEVDRLKLSHLQEQQLYPSDKPLRT